MAPTERREQFFEGVLWLIQRWLLPREGSRWDTLESLLVEVEATAFATMAGLREHSTAEHGPSASLRAA